MDHPFMKNLAEELALHSVTTVRFNFPYMENKRGRPDPPVVATKSVEAVVLKAQSLFPKLPVIAGGKSFGGRMTSTWASAAQPNGLKGIVFLDFPSMPRVHRPMIALSICMPSNFRCFSYREQKMLLLILRCSSLYARN